MINYKHRGESSCRGGPEKQRLKKAVESALEGKKDRWAIEEKSARFQEINKDVLDLRNKFYELHSYGETETPLIDMTYNAATRMTDGLKELLERPLHVANVPKSHGESGVDKHINHNRNGFMNSLLDVLEATNISLGELEEKREQRDEAERKLGS